MKQAINTITSWQTLEQAVLSCGFLPFFKNDISGFSVEELTPPELWFSDTEEGPWEWKGPAARNLKCVYGKLFQKKAGFVSLEWLPDLANYRRNGYDFDSRYEEGLVSQKDKTVYDAVAERGTLLSKELKRLCNYRKGGSKGFETVITRLQMQTYIITADFEYMKDKYGSPYGWGVAKYGIPELLLGSDPLTSAYIREPEESLERIITYLKKLLPKASEQQIMKIVKYR
ncbi:MAG: hypothetical protein NC394_03880 [Bacteroides sp.]|nr:hypothetical protein [Bacteroides sp.]